MSSSVVKRLARVATLTVLMAVTSISFLSSHIGERTLVWIHLKYYDWLGSDEILVAQQPPRVSPADAGVVPHPPPSSNNIGIAKPDPGSADQVEDYAHEPPARRLRYVLRDLRSEARKLSLERNQLSPESKSPRSAKSYQWLIEAADRLETRIQIVIEAGQELALSTESQNPRAMSSPEGDSVVTAALPQIEASHPSGPLFDPPFIVSLIGLVVTLVVMIWGDNLSAKLKWGRDHGNDRLP